jgi:folate-binding protein YgfZ
MNPQPTRALVRTPLTAEHLAAGAKLSPWFGCALPDVFTEVSAEYRFASESVALADKNYRAFFRFAGPDRGRLLNAMLTNNLRDLAAGQGNVSLLLSPQGHILAEIEAYAAPKDILGVSYAMIQRSLATTFERFIIMDDVTLADETDHLSALAIEGPRARDLVRELCGVDLAVLPELGHVQAHVEQTPLRVVKRSPGGIPGAEFIAERAQLLSLWRRLLEAARAAGGGPAGYLALSALRIEQGIPWFGYDFDERHIPHEAGLQNTHISYTKGCYTGQEIVERVRSRGQVNRLRVGLKFRVAELPGPGAALLARGTETGYVTRAAFSPALGCPIGMGYVRRESSSPGTKLTCAEGVAEVIPLPLAPTQDARNPVL